MVRGGELWKAKAAPFLALRNATASVATRRPKVRQDRPVPRHLTLTTRVLRRPAALRYRSSPFADEFTAGWRIVRHAIELGAEFLRPGGQ
jgi:hypothetical protein